ncbi:hypothetical protein LCGC14_1970020 [marine sediment metagenome]|uniref:Lipoyl-binding domain-containing protein n=1 Tax=marine sediment metagenome TaxID=412755 RepID=A0A0F9FC27_9ZZZZ
MVPEDLSYTRRHEWVKLEGNIAAVGITHYAQDALGDITFVDLPEVSRALPAGAEACAIESCKAAASVYTPVAGKIVEVNSALEDDPGAINSDPYGAGWIYKIELADPAEASSLLSAEQYRALLAEEGD